MGFTRKKGGRSFIQVKKRIMKKGGKHNLQPPGPEQCHPRVGNERPLEGCLPQEVLQEVATNLGLPNASRKTIEEHLNVPAKQEYSFVNALPFDERKKKELMKQYLRPKQPDSWSKDPDKWLNTFDILNVMNQYEESHPDFEFLGAHPIDFGHKISNNDPNKCLVEEICKIDINESLAKNKKYIGIVFNLDPSYKSGSHWVALYIDLVKHKTYYFDSYAVETPIQIEKFMKWLTTQDPKMKLFWNGNRFQYMNSECGMYSMYFIIRMLMGDDFQTFSRTKPPDSYMLDLRDWLFST